MKKTILGLVLVAALLTGGGVALNAQEYTQTYWWCQDYWFGINIGGHEAWGDAYPGWSSWFGECACIYVAQCTHWIDGNGVVQSSCG